MMAQATSTSAQSQPQAVVIRQFEGMKPNADPHDVTPGTSLHQVNVMAGPPGELRVRLGCKQILFDPI